MNSARSLIGIIVASILFSFATPAPSGSETVQPLAGVSDSAPTSPAGLISRRSTQLSNLESITSSDHANAEIFLGVMQSCNDIAVRLDVILNSLLGTTLQISTEGVVRALAKTVTKVEVSTKALENVVACTDATVALSVYDAFSTFVVTQQKVFAFIAADASLWVRLNLKVSLHAVLVSLQNALTIYVSLLFKYITNNLNDVYKLKVALFVDLQAAIDACI